MFRFPIREPGGGGGFPGDDLIIDDGPGVIDDGGGSIGGPGGGTIIPPPAEATPLFVGMSWSPSNNHLILSSLTGTDPTTNVSVTLEEASLLGSGWTARAYTNKSGWRSSSWVSLNTSSYISSTTIPIVLGDNEVPSYGQNESFIMYTQVRSPTGTIHTNFFSVSCQITNNIDSSGPEHISAAWTDGNTFTLPAGSGSGSTVSRVMYWDVRDLQSGISNVSASASVGSLVSTTSVSIGSGITRYIYTLTINGTVAASNTSVSVSFSARNGVGTTTFGTILYGSISLSDTTAPSISVTSNSSKTVNLYTSNNTHNNTTNYSIGFKVTDAHSSISSVTVTGNNSTATNTLGTLTNHGSGNYSQAVSVPASNASLGGSASYTYTIRATDSSGNIGSATASFTLNRYDNSAPTASVSGNTSTITFNTSNGTSQTSYKSVSFAWSDHSSIDTGSIQIEKVGGKGYWSHGSWSGNTYSGRWNVSQSSISVESSSTETFRAKVRDTHGNQGTSSNFQFSFANNDNVSPSISVQNVSSHTFYSSSSGTTTQTGYVWWSASDSHSSISSASASKIGSSSYISSVGSTNSTSENGAQYKTSYVIVRSVGFGSSYTTRGSLIRLLVSDAGGNQRTHDVGVSLRYIDNVNPYFNAPAAKYHTFYTSQGNSATANMSVTVPVADAHSGIASGTVVKKSGSSNWSSPTSVSLSGGNLSFTIPLSASVLSANSSYVSQTVTMTITDNAGRSVSEDWTGYVRRIDNTGPSISGPSSITDYHFTTTGSSSISRNVDFTVSDAHNSIDTNSFSVYIEPNTYITTSGVSHVSGNTYRYTVTVPRSGKSIHTSSTDFGFTRVTVEDNYDNSSSLTTTHYGTHKDTTRPSINNAQMSGRFDFTTSSFSTTSITRNLTFSCSDAHSSLNSASITTSSAQVSIGSVNRSGNNYTVPITLTRAGLTSDHGATVVINVSDSAGNAAIAKTVALAGSYVDNKGPVFGTTSISGGSTAAFLLSSGTNSISRVVTIPVSDEIQLNTFSVQTLGSAKCSISGLNNISSTSDDLQFTVTFDKSDYSLESSQTESVRVTAYDTSNQSNFKDVSFTVKYDDDVAPTISSASTISVDFVQSNSQSSKTVTHSFSVADSGVGPNAPTVSGALAGSVSHAGGLNYTVPITVQRSAFTHYAGYQNVGTITITVNDGAGNPKSQNVTVRAKLTDDVAPSLGTASPGNLSLDTTSSDHVRGITISVSDASGINSSSLEVTRVNGSGSVSGASYSSGNISFNVTTRPSDYTANNSYVYERFRIRIADVNGHMSAYRYVAYYVRVADATPPVLTLVQAPSFSLNQSGPSSSSSKVVIRATDAHSGINANSFRFIGLAPSDDDRLEGTATTQFNPTGNANEWEFDAVVGNTGVVGLESIHGVVIVEDNAGNSSSIQIPIDIPIIDNVAPVISNVSYLSNVNVYSSNNREQSVNVTFTVTDTAEVIPGNQVVVTKTSNGPVAQATVVQGVSRSGTTYTLPIIVKASALGHNQTETLSYNIIARDSVPNLSQVTSISFTVKVIDNIDPVVTKTGSIPDFTLNNTTNTSRTVTATFSISDDVTSAGNLSLSATSGWGVSKNGGTVTLSKNFTHASGVSGSQSVTLTATDSAGRSDSASDSFVISRFSADLTDPEFVDVLISSNDGGKTRLDSNTQSAGIIISGKVIDTGTGIDASSLKIISSSNGTIAAGNTMSPTSYNPSTGQFTFVFTWNYNDLRWFDLWSNNGSVVFTEDFVMQVADNQGAPYTNYKQHTVTAQLIRDDVIAPSMIISSVKVNGSDVSSSNPIDITDRVNGDSNSGFTEAIEIKILAADSQTGLDSNSWSLTLRENNDPGYLTFLSANGGYNENDASPNGLTVTNDAGIEGGYKINMRFHAPQFIYGSLGSQAYGGSPYGNSDFTLTLSVSDHRGNTTIATAPIVINRIDGIAPTIGALQARSGSLNSITVSQSSTTYTHQIKVAASDSQSGIASVVMNNGYSADGTGTESGTLFYYFKRTYVWADIWNNNHPSTLSLTGVRATATDNQGNVSHSGSQNITVSAIDVVNPNIVSRSVTYTQIDLNTEDTTPITNHMVVTIRDDDHSGATVVAKKGGITKNLITVADNRFERVYSTSVVYDADQFSLGDTIENWTIEVTDSAGNKSTSSFPQITISKEDGTSPIISAVQLKMASTNLEMVSLPLNIASTTPVVLNAIVTVNDAHSSISSVVANVGGGVPVTKGATTGSGPFTIPLTFNPSAVGLHANNQNFIMSITVVATDSAGNSSNYVKSLPVVLNDYSPPTISNVTANNVVLNHDHNGSSDPPDQVIQLEADVSDVGSGLSSVVAKVTFNTGVIQQTNQMLSLVSAVSGHYIWRKTVSADQLIVNASPTNYSFQITATPILGIAANETKVATAQLIDNSPPRCMIVTKKMDNSVLTNNSNITIQSEVGAVSLKYILTAIERSTPIVLTSVRLNGLPVPYTVESNSNNSVTAVVNYTASMVLALTGGNYSQYAGMTVNMLVEDQHDNEVQVAASTINMEVNDNTDPIVVTQTAVSPSSITVNETSGAKTVTVTASFRDNEEGIHTGNTQIVDANGGNLQAGIVQSLDTALSNGGKDATVTAVLSFNYDTAGIQYGENVRSVRIRVGDVNGNVRLSDVVAFVVKRIDAVPPTISNVEVRINNNLTQTANISDNVQTASLAISAVVGDNKAVPVPLLRKNGATGIQATNFSSGYGQAYGGLYTWQFTIDEDDYNFGTTQDSYQLSVTDSDGLSAPTITKTVTVVKTDVIPPTITLLAVGAVELDANGNEGQSLLAAGNLVTLYTDPNGSQPHRARLKITAQVSDEGGLKTGSPFISGDIAGWSLLSGTPAGIYVWQKDVSSVTPGMLAINTTVNARDTSNIAGTPKTATFNIDTRDNTKPLISLFEMTGIVEVNEIPTITLRESSSSITQDATIKLRWSDNGTTVPPLVTITYGSPAIIAETLTASVTAAGENIYYKSFDYEDFTSSLPVGQIIPVTIGATVTDVAGNVRSQSLTARMELIDDSVPLINTYNLTGGTTSSNRGVLSFGNSGTYVFTSSGKANGNDRLYLEANVTAEDLRGIASIAVSSSPALSWVEVSTGTFRADIGYDDLGLYSTPYSYTITTVVTDNSGQSASASKTIAFSKIDDVIPVATLGSIVGLTNGKAILKSSDTSEKTLNVNINVNENTVGTMGGALLTGLGPGLAIHLTGVVHPAGSTNRVYSYDVTLDRSDYKFINLTDENLNNGRIDTEVLSFRINDAQGNSSGVTQIISIPVELEDDIAPTGSISTAADAEINGGVNKVNLTTNSAQDGHKVYVYANFFENQTDIDPATIGIVSGSAHLTFNKSYDSVLKRATFNATVTSAFYSSLTQYDSYENKTFTVTGKDYADNSVTMSISIGFKRSDVLPPVINNFSLSDTSIIHLDEHISEEQKSIEVILSASVSDERGLSDQYVTYTKNGVLQPVRLPSVFQGPWSNLTFVSVKPDPFDPNASDDVYVFTLHSVDLNNQETTANATLTVEYDDINNPIIHNANFYENNSVITQKLISTNGHASQYGISETVQFKARLSDLGDDITQLTVALDENGLFSNAAISNISRVANEVIGGHNYAVFDVILTTGVSWGSSLQPITVLLTVTDRRGNSVNLTRNLNIAIADESPPVISSLSLQCFGSSGNNLVASGNPSHKAGNVRGELIVYDESGLDISSASLVSSDGRVFSNIGNQPSGTIDGRNATKITFNLAVNYDDPQFNLGANTLTATANIDDTAGQAATPVTSSCTIDKLDQLSPQILGLAFVEDNVTSVKDGAWAMYKIQGTGNANMQGQKSLSSWIVIDTTIPTSTANQVLLSVGGQEDEQTLIMAIKNHRFTVHAGLNKDETVRNKSALMSWDMRDGASSNPLHQFRGSTESVELALLVRLDIGVIMLYANGRLIAAEQAKERSFVAYGGSTPTLSVGNADPVASNRSVHADISGAWQGTISAFNIYDWSSGGSNKVAHESSVVVANVSDSKATANGKVVFANLDNEQTTLSFKENNVNSIDHVSTFANVSTFNKNIAYDQNLGDNTQDISYQASSTQNSNPHSSVPGAPNQYNDSETLTIRKVNTDEESPVINDLVITHETANGGPKILGASDIVTLGSSSTESILVTIAATDNAASGVADTESFSITVGGTTLSTTKLAGSGLQHRLVLDWETLNGISGPGHGDYTLAISAKVVDHAGNKSLAKNENLTIRAVDQEAPEITGAVFHTGGLVRTGDLEDNNLVINVSVSSASPSAEVDMTVRYTDNSHHLNGSAVSINPVGSVYAGGPGIWTGTTHAPRGFTVISSNALLGVYEARMKRTFVYSELSSKGSNQYRMDGLNQEGWTVTVTDGNNQSHSKNFTINVTVVDDVNPGVPSVSLSPATFVLNPGDQQHVVATITTADDNGIEVSGVELLSSMHSAGANDIAVLVGNAAILDATPANPHPANKKVFTAAFTVDYSDVTGTHSIAKEYKIGAKITDLANNSSLILDGARLVIEREDTEAPEIVYTKRYHYSANYNTYPALALNSGTYNVVNVSNTISQPDLRFTITDNDALNPATIKMHQSLPIEAISTNPALAVPAGGVYSGATEIAMNVVGGVYQPANPVSFNPASFSKFHRNGDGHSYYVWVRVQAEDMAQNKTELHIPFKVNKVDTADPSAVVSVNTTQRNGANEVNGVASGFVTHVANSIVRANLRSDSTHAVVQVRVVASDNDTVKAVGTAPTGSVIQASATGPVMIGGVSTYTIERVYAFNDNDHLGDRFIEDFNVIIEDETGNTRAHRIPVHINGQDVIAPSISITMTTEGNNGSTELKYPGDNLTIVVRAEITDAGSDVNVGTVQLVGASGYSSLGLVNGKYEWRKTVTWSNSVQLPLIVTESVSVQAEDNDGNARIVNGSLDYSMTSNLNMSLNAGRIYLEEDGAYGLITEASKAINPNTTYNVKFEWVIQDPNNLLAPNNSDVVITGASAPSLVGNVTKSGTAGLQTYTAIVAIDTNNMTKGQNNSISVQLTARDPYTQTRSYTLTQQFFVWDYETIDENNDYYIMYAANINPSITKLTDSNNQIKGYKMLAKSTAFSNVNPVQVNYPTGQVKVEARPFEIIKYAAGSNDVVESTESFKVEADVYADSNGTVDAEVILEDKTVTISYADDFTLAQLIYSNMDSSELTYQPPIDAATPDILSRTYGPQRLLGNPIINAVISARVVDQGLHSSSPPSVGIVDLQEITSSLDQIALRNGTFGQNDIMQEGDLLVLSGTAPYERKVTDIHGVEHTLVANQPMKLLLRQTTGAGII